MTKEKTFCKRKECFAYNPAAGNAGCAVLKESCKDRSECPFKAPGHGKRG